MIDETTLTALVRQSMEPTEAEESRAAVPRLADEIRRLWKEMDELRAELAHVESDLSERIKQEWDERWESSRMYDDPMF